MELLVVIAIIGIMGTIVTINLTKSFRDAKERGCAEFIKRVEEGTCVYASLSNKTVVCTRDDCEPIPLQAVISAGFVKEEFNACTERPIEEYYDTTITVTWSPKGQKECNYNGQKEYERQDDNANIYNKNNGEDD